MSTDESVVTVGANTGILKGLKDGEALVIGTLGEVRDTLTVTVERPTAHVMPIDPNLDIATWKLSQTGGKNVKATAVGSGIDYEYTGAAGRAPKSCSPRVSAFGVCPTLSASPSILVRHL